MHGHYLYRIQAVRPEMLSEGPTPEEAEIVAEHSRYLEVLAGQGKVVLYGRTQNSDPSAFGIVIFTAESEVAAREIMENDPAVLKELMNADLFPYKITYLAGS